MRPTRETGRPNAPTSSPGHGAGVTHGLYGPAVGSPLFSYVVPAYRSGDPPAAPPPVRPIDMDTPMDRPSFVPHPLPSAHVLLRFAMRLVGLAAVAAMSTRGFAATFAALLALAAFYCLLVAVQRREAPFGPVLTHVDEAAVYALCAGLLSRL